MQQIQRAKSYLLTHRKVRIALIAALVLLAALVVFHPRGTKTYLVIGMDNYGALENSGRGDVTMLVQVDFTRSKISVATFARDMFLENEKGGLTKINTIVKSRAEDGLVELMEKNFGVEIDGWFLVNFTSVVELVDAIGGAKVELTDKEVRYLANQGLNVFPDYPLVEGKCQLNGAQALAYARCRKLDNDLGRGARQSKLMAAMVAQTRHLTVPRIVNVFNSLKHAWTSSLSGTEQISLLGKAVWLRGAKVERIGMPLEGHWHYGEAYGTSGVVADLPENRRLLRALLGYPAEPQTQDAK